MTAKISDFPCILMLPFSENQKRKRRDRDKTSHLGALFCKNFGFQNYKIANLHCRVYEQMVSKSGKFIKK